MGFSKKIKDDILVLCARHCSVCNKPAGLNFEVHHIVPSEQGGKDIIENAILLCFNCHADAGHYFAGHPKGLKLSPEELKKHKKRWLQSVEVNQIQVPKDELVQLVFRDKEFDGVFKPVFIKETTIYNDRYLYKRTYELLGKDPMEFINDLKKKYDTFSPFYDPFLNSVETYEEYMDYLNGNHFEFEDIDENKDCQPIVHSAPSIIGSGRNKEINLSNCTLSLKLSNIGNEVLEDYKVYLNFENVVSIDSVNKRDSFFDTHEYNYNIFFNVKKGEIIPDSNILVQKDSVVFDDICFRVKPQTKEVIIEWELLSRGYSTRGSIKLKIDSVIEDDERIKYVENPDEMKEIIRFLPKLEFE